MNDKIPMIVVAGPTASGKTRLAADLALVYDGEVVSADSMQIYKGLSIATAKPTFDEMRGVPHHLIDFLEPEEPFSVADYVKLAKQTAEDIYNRGRLPILCGGTGLYVSSLIDNVSFDDTAGDEQIRKRLMSEAQTLGAHELWLKLNEVDHETAAKVHENNLPRVIRGLEVYEITGVPLSRHKINSRREKSPFNCCIIGLNFRDRQKLYDRINRRVDLMLENGLIDEARDFYKTHTPQTACQAIGYKELIPYLEGKVNLDDSIAKIKQETRHYAKRQLTWFRKVDGIQWIYGDEIGEYKKILENTQNIIAKSKIL